MVGTLEDHSSAHGGTLVSCVPVGGDQQQICVTRSRIQSFPQPRTVIGLRTQPLEAFDTRRGLSKLFDVASVALSARRPQQMSEAETTIHTKSNRRKNGFAALILVGRRWQQHVRVEEWHETTD
mmetsp:Transcript_8953/g.24202  ORF Transcript_8953/g.24202 Transcript_8953/m.24202 type:complete len:124 (+) Transcript_8953:499-870(+)